MTFSQQHVFISHSNKDHGFCIHLVDDLRRILGDDDAVWYDTLGGFQSHQDALWYELSHREPYGAGVDGRRNKLKQELSKRTIFLLVLSPDALASSQVNEEVNIAWQRSSDPDPASRMQIIPILYRPCEVPDDIGTLQIISFLPPTTYEAALQELLIALGLSPQAARVQSQKNTALPSRVLTTRPEEIKLLHTLAASGRFVYSVAVSADGRRVLSGGEGIHYEGMIKLWNGQTGELLYTLIDHTEEVCSVAMTTGGQVLASGSRDMTVKLWNGQTGELLHTLTGHRLSVFSLAFRPDGQVLASGSSDNTIKLWHVQTGQLLGTLTGHRNSVYCVVWSVDGQTLASSSWDYTIKLWNVRTGQLLGTLTDHSDAVYCVAWSTDRRRTLASGSEDGTVKLWNVRTGQLLHTLAGHGGAVSSVAWSADGQTLASGDGYGAIRLWNGQTGELLRMLVDKVGYVFSLAWSADGQTLASGSGVGTVKLWGVKK